MKSAEELLEVKAEIQLHESEAFVLKGSLKKNAGIQKTLYSLWRSITKVVMTTELALNIDKSVQFAALLLISALKSIAGTARRVNEILHPRPLW